MALQQIQKSSSFKPDMIGDVVEVTLYNKADGDLITTTGVLAGYQVGGGRVGAWLDHDRDGEPSFTAHLDEVTVSITHYEFALGIEVEEDGE